MINLAVRSGAEIIATQVDPSPRIYLDHWALMDLAHSAALRERFVRALSRTGGTLLLSRLNLLEFAGVRDNRTVLEAEELLNQTGNRIAFIDTNPFHVVEREDEQAGGASGLPPYYDMQLLSEYAATRRPGTVLVGASGLLGLYRDPRLEAHFLADIQAARERGESYKTYRAKRRTGLHLGRLQFYREDSTSGRLQRVSVRQFRTLHVLEDVMNLLEEDNFDLSKRNNWNDLFHMVVPTSHCDAVVLDKLWATKVEHIRARLARRGLATEGMAAVFAKPTIDEFWNFMEADAT